MLFLVDGYNLMHAAGLAARNLPPGQLQSGRRRLLDWLANAPAVRKPGTRVVVVFDAQNGRAGTSHENHRGIEVRYAHRETADDLIETLLAAEPRNSPVTVASNDGRLQESARRRGFRGWSCPQFTDWIVGGREPPAPPPPPTDDAVRKLSAADDAALLEAFLKPKPR